MRLFNGSVLTGPFPFTLGGMTPRLRLGWLPLVLLLATSSGCDFGKVSAPTAPDQSNVPYAQIDLTVGTGAEAVVASTVTVVYGAWLYSDTAIDHKGTQVDQNTLTFVLGTNPTQVIVGFDKGVTGMKVGGTRRVIVPPSMAYGANGNGSAIPPNAALVFDIGLTGVTGP